MNFFPETGPPQRLINARRPKSGVYEGTSLEESLLLFGGSYIGYIGWNIQITYRAFMFPLLALSVAFLYRLQHARPTPTQQEN